MRSLSIAVVSACIVSATFCIADANGRPSSDGPGREVVLFGASWCAPCIVEMRDLRPIAAAAYPDRIVIVWEDEGLARLALPALVNVEVAAPTRARRLAAELASRRTGLPYAAVVTASGQRCAEHRGRVTPDVVTGMKLACNAAGGG